MLSSITIVQIIAKQIYVLVICFVSAFPQFYQETLNSRTNLFNKDSFDYLSSEFVLCSFCAPPYLIMHNTLNTAVH